MCILGYPPEIQKLVDTFDPYRKEILSKRLFCCSRGSVESVS